VGLVIYLLGLIISSKALGWPDEEAVSAILREA
jgi:hypothetical protein